MFNQNNMFSNFPNSNTQYMPNNFQGCFPNQLQNSGIQSVSPNKPYELKNPDGSLKGYFWYYGNSVELIFNLKGEITNLPGETYISASQIIKDLILVGNVYDFRNNKIISFSNNVGAEYPLAIEVGDSWESDGATVTMDITNEISLKLPKGYYYIDLVATHLLSGYCETLFSQDTCVFEVR